MKIGMLRVTSLLLLALATALACSPPRGGATPPASAPAPLVAGTSGEYPPLSSWGRTAERPTGFAPSLVQGFAEREHRELRWLRFRWPELGRDVATRRFVLAADGITVRADRSLAGRFTVPIARGGAVLLVRPPRVTASDSTPKARASALDRAGVRIVVNRGGHLEQVTRALFQVAEIRAIPDNAAVREAFARGEADAAMTNTFEAPGWAEGLTGVEAIGPLTNDVTALWLGKDEEELAVHLDDFLLDEEEHDRLASLRRAAFGSASLASGQATACPVSALLAATMERLALMPLVAAAKAGAGLAITDGAQEERVLAATAKAVERAAAERHVAAPSRTASNRFFRAQIDAAKRVQGKASAATAAATLDELRAAIARITARMARLLVRVPRAMTAEAVAREARDWLSDSALDEATLTELAAAIAGAAPP